MMITNPSWHVDDASIKTIRYALKFLLSVNQSIDRISGSKVRKEAAIRDIDRCEKAIDDFDSLLKKLECD